MLDITLQMVKPKTNNIVMDVKASETKGLMVYLGEFLSQTDVRDRVRQGPVWGSVARAIVKHMHVMDTSQWRLRHDQYMDC